MNEVFEELSRNFPKLSFVQLEAENFPDVSEEFEIESVPTFILLQVR
jgi:thioredoxin-like negative regulator of GroEL